jgi:dipeptidyl aminopeptidase/acylaminoacyl peptidase
MRHTRIAAFFFFACAALVTIVVRPHGQAARPAIEDVLRRLDQVRAIRETALAPDGSRLAWVVDIAAKDGGGTAVYVGAGPRAGGLDTPFLVTAKVSSRGAHERAIAWSPDSKSLAFLSDAETPGKIQLYVCEAGMRRSRTTDIAPLPGPLHRVTNVVGQLSHPVWSPDGKRLAVLYVAGSVQETGALVAYKPDEGVVGDSFDEQRIAVVDAAGGELKSVSPADMFVYDYDWSPNGQAFAAEAVKGSGTDNYWIAQLYVVSAATGETRSLWKPPLQLAWPRWSFDGASIAVIHGIMSDEGQTGGDVYLVPAAGGPPKNVTPGLEGSARSIEWLADGALMMQEYVDGKSAWSRIPKGGGARTLLGGTEQQFSATSVASNGSRALLDSSMQMTDVVSGVVQSLGEAPEVYAGAPGAWTRQTDVNTQVKPLWGPAKSLHWKSDNFTIQGWLVCPQNVSATDKLPLVVAVHGGPSSAQMSAWPTRWNAVLPTQGYCVLMPNPRGSYGNGEAFTQANVKDFGYGDLRDIIAGIDAAAANGPVDPNRVGVIGWSYGGYMTMWAVTQTTRFKAAVAGAGIVSWQSYYGQNRIDTWMLPFFGASVYDDPAVYAKSSPITYIKKAKTPTLVLHGDRDSEVPTPQGYEFWHALKTLGVPTELVIYPGEGHAIAKPEHQADIQRRSVAWFDKYLAWRPGL